MAWRFLVDEDTDTATVNELADRGFDAVTVAAALGKGALDPAVAEFARRENRVLITTDRHFLDPTLTMGFASSLSPMTGHGDEKSPTGWPNSLD